MNWPLITSSVLYNTSVLITRIYMPVKNGRSLPFALIRSLVLSLFDDQSMQALMRLCGQIDVYA